MTAQQFFDAALKDEAVRKRLMIAAAKSDGKWIDEGFCVAVPDYMRDLNAVARLKLPETMKRWFDDNDGDDDGSRTDGIDNWDTHLCVASVDYHDPADEALARLCCLAEACGWEV
jgi:hypothetical protein